MRDPDLPIHCATFIGLRQRLRFVYSRSSPALDCVTYFWVTLWPWLWPFDLEQFSYMASHVTSLRLSFLELRVITFPIGYHWKCVRGHCACAESPDTWVGSEKRLHFWNTRPRFAYSLYNFGGSTMNIIKVICENNARPSVKKCMRFCACVKSRDLLKVP